MDTTNRQFLLAKRPIGAPTRDTFEFVEKPLGELGPNQILVKNEYLSLDPAMRGWMNDAKSYIPPVGIGEVMRALGVGKVIASQHPGFAEGDYVNGGHRRRSRQVPFPRRRTGLRCRHRLQERRRRRGPET